MSLSGGSWEREGPGGGRDGVIAFRTIREIDFSDCARPRQSPVSLSLSLSLSLAHSVCGQRRAAEKNRGPSRLPAPPLESLKPS